MASDGGPMFPDPAPADDGWSGMSVRDAFAVALASTGQIPVDTSAPMSYSREVYDVAQAMTDEKLRRDKADRNEGKG